MWLVRHRIIRESYQYTKQHVIFSQSYRKKIIRIKFYGVVTQESLEQAKAEYEGEIRMTRATPTSVYMTLPTWANNAIVKTSLAAPRYGQTNIYYYFTKDNANIYAMSLDTGSTEGLLALLGGFIPKVGPVIAIMFTVSSLSKGEIDTKIRNLTRLELIVQLRVLVHFMVCLNGLDEL